MGGPIALFAEKRSGSGGGSGTVDVEDEGAAEGAADTIDFAGAGVSVTFAGGKATVTIPGGASTWDTIGAAAGDGSTDNGDNNIVYRVAKTTNSEQAFRFTESAAATNGTSTSGVPNQVLLRVDTVAASTMSPLSVYSRANHVFSVSPTSTQILAANGTTAAPIYSFAADPASGLTSSLAIVRLVSNGTIALSTTATQTQIRAGSAAAPGLNDLTTGSSGLFWNSSPVAVGISVSNAENSQWQAGLYQLSKGSGDAIAYAVNTRKSRGTVASPSAITTGDDLLTVSGFGYVGGTGTYVEGCRITFDSTGTIANNTSGMGGIMRFEVAKVGAVGPVEIMRLTRGTTTGGGWATMNEADANPAAGDLADGDEAAIYVKAGNIVFAQNVGGTVNFLYCPLDGSTNTWTANTTGP